MHWALLKDEQHEKLKRALRAEIDEWRVVRAALNEALSSRSTIDRKIATKVINHYWRRGAEGV